MSRARAWRALALAACAVVALTGCESDGGAATSDTSASTASTSATTQPSTDGAQTTTTAGAEAPIEVATPEPFDILTDTMRLSGSAEVFEATVSWQITNNSGVQQEGFLTASCGTGCRGTFDETIPLRVKPGNYNLLVFEASAKDGSHLHELHIPITVHAQ